MTQPSPELSIIIPVYNEEGRLPRALEKIHAFTEGRHLPSEVIVVDDGSSDGTVEVVNQWRARLPELRLISYAPNRGKGYAVRRGMLEAQGRIALFTDVDLSAPIEEADKLLAALEQCDVAFGSRINRKMIQVHQSFLREVAGKTFNKVVQLVTGVRFIDTQCGFKAFRRARTRILFEQQRIERFGFDPELLFLARRQGLRAVEVPVLWAHDPATKVQVLRDGLGMLAELLSIRWHWLLGRYPKVTTS